MCLTMKPSLFQRLAHAARRLLRKLPPSSPTSVLPSVFFRKSVETVGQEEAEVFSQTLVRCPNCMEPILCEVSVYPDETMVILQESPHPF